MMRHDTSLSPECHSEKGVLCVLRDVRAEPSQLSCDCWFAAVGKGISLFRIFLDRAHAAGVGSPTKPSDGSQPA